MKIAYKSKKLEKIIVVIKAVASAMVVATFILLFGFDEPLLLPQLLYKVQIGLLFVFIAGKSIRLLNVQSKKEYFIANWFEIPLLIGLVAVIYGSNHWFKEIDPAKVRQMSIGIYLVIEVIIKICIASVALAATGRNPTTKLIASFVILISVGAGLLMLPKSSTAGPLGFTDALFTATSATCVTGLIVKDTGQDFSIMGQIIILVLIQLGGLGIVVFGAVFALLLGQALSLQESVAMQDLLSARTLNRIVNMIVFIFAFTVIIEAVGAVSMYGMWDNIDQWNGGMRQQWFCSIFHSVSAFCNAGFCLFSDSFINYNRQVPIYLVICPLIILGGLGFGVLYNLVNTSADRLKRLARQIFQKKQSVYANTPKRISLQTKIVVAVSIMLILLGALVILIFEQFAIGPGQKAAPDVLAALFQSITARTAGFNTVKVSAMTPAAKMVLIILMFIGGSPGSTAGGIKTVSLAVIIMYVFAVLRKRPEVEIYRRSVRNAVVGRAITVTVLFIIVLFISTLALNITEKDKLDQYSMMDIMFESASALGTVGLSTGITRFLTVPGKFIIIITMLIGRLGPLTLLAALTFNLKPVPYNYPEEAIIVG